MLKLSFFRGLFYGLFFSSFLWAGIFYTVKTITNNDSVEIETQSEVPTSLVATNEF